MSIITIRCRLVAGVKQQIDKKSIKNFSAEDRVLLQKLLDDKSHADRDNPKDKEEKLSSDTTTFRAIIDFNLNLLS
jgi:hypothetical protein